MNNPAIKWVAVIAAAALVIVLAVIFIVNDTDKQDSAGEPAAAATEEPGQIVAQPRSEEQEALSTDDGEAQNDLYEGALAGLTEEEIGELAMAEENSSLRTEDSGAEGAVD